MLVLDADDAKLRLSEYAERDPLVDGRVSSEGSREHCV